VAAIAFAPAAGVAYAGVLAGSVSFGAIAVLVPHMVSGLFPERRTQAMSLLVSFYTLGAVVANLVVLLLVQAGAGWRTGYLVASGLAVPWGILLAAMGSASVEAAFEPAGTRGTPESVGRYPWWPLAVFTSMRIPTFMLKEVGAAPAFAPVSLLAFCLVGLGTGGFVPTVTVRVAERFPRASASRYSLFMAVGNLGPLIGPLVIGLAAGGDLRKGILTMIPAGAVAGAILLLGRGTGAPRQGATGTSA
jgi:MFS family permease